MRLQDLLNVGMKERREKTDAGLRSAAPLTAFRESIAGCVRAVAKKFLPSSAIHELRRYRMYGGRERALYLKIRAMNAIGVMNSRISQPPRTARSFLFVCFGNVIRSPMCETLLKQALPGPPSRHVAVSSAGLNAVPGRPAHPWATAAAQEFGISLENHRARLLTRDMVDQADAIFAMDYDNLVQLLSRYPDAGDKVFMLSAYASEDYPAAEITDPYLSGAEATRRCYTILNTCIKNLVHSLARIHKPDGVKELTE